VKLAAVVSLQTAGFACITLGTIGITHPTVGFFRCSEARTFRKSLQPADARKETAKRLRPLSRSFSHRTVTTCREALYSAAQFYDDNGCRDAVGREPRACSH
jgi:hypothetical protein